jgi:hypothetical protein
MPRAKLDWSFNVTTAPVYQKSTGGGALAKPGHLAPWSLRRKIRTRHRNFAAGKVGDI